MPEIEDEPVEPVRVMPPLAETVQDAPADEPEVVEEAVAPTELPLVADDVVQAARELGIQIWSNGLTPLARLHPGRDQALAHAVSMKWLVVDDQVIVRGEVDPRPVSVTRIPS